MGGAVRAQIRWIPAGRGYQDAIEAIFLTSTGRNPARQWALDADLEAAFDRIDHARLLTQLGSFPARGMSSGGGKPACSTTADSPQPHKAPHRAASSAPC
jgi:hypothetical protein